MEKIIELRIEHLPEGGFLATSESIQGLVAQGRTISETLEIAKDVVRKLIEARSPLEMADLPDDFAYPLVVGV
jgi:predicted RNase H-like HicB family nuclease